MILELQDFEINAYNKRKQSEKLLAAAPNFPLLRALNFCVPHNQ